MQDTNQTLNSAAAEERCPIRPAVDVLSRRWTSPILWTLNEFGQQRFGELERRIPSVSSKVLTERLRQLERDGLVIRTYHAEVPPRVEYEISELGRSLGNLFAHLTEWGTTNLEEVKNARERYDAGPTPGSRTTS